MAKIDPKALKQLIKDAGVGERTARKLVDANETDDAPKSRGHGAASEDRTSLGDV